MSDNIFIGTNGNDIFKGGNGTDTVTFAGASNGYLIETLDDGRVRITDIDVTNGKTGTDILSSIETLRFADKDYGLATLPSDELQGAIRVNTTTAYSQEWSSMTALSDGGYVVTWSSNGHDNGYDENVYSQRYDALGHKVGGETLVNTSTSFNQFMPETASLANGGYVVTWIGWDGSDFGIFAQQFNGGGARVNGEIRVNTAFSDYQTAPDITSLADGGFVITWSSRGQDGSDFGIYAQRYNATGGKVGGETLINTTTTNSQVDSAVAGLSDGGYVITWESFGQDGSLDGIYAQRFNSSGSKVGGETLVNTTIEGYQSHSTITGLANGGYVISWGGYYEDDLYAQCFDAAGNKVGGETKVNTSAVWQDSPKVVSLTGGGYIIAWDGALQRFDDNGNKVGAEQSINFNQYSAYAVDICALADGGYIVSWTGQNGILADSNDIYTLRYDANGNPWGPPLVEVTGTAGNDTIRAGAGKQYLQGLEGSDRLYGGDGNDTLSGGAGSDTLEGGDGNDTYILSDADTIVDTWGGLDTVRSSFSYTLGAHLEKLVLTGSGNLNGTGNSEHNTITGNTGNNVLTGGAGIDRLDGGAGSDTLVGGMDDDIYYLNDGDTVVENVGQGTDLVVSSISYTLTSNVENLTLTGSDNIAGTGNSLANGLTGNSGNNTLDGGGGNDTLKGGNGDDTYVTDGNDLIMENAYQGTDTVRSSVTYKLGINLENLVLTGSADINGRGNNLGNVLTGNSGSNDLFGGGGHDVLIGGLGDDTLSGGNGNDIFRFDTVPSGPNGDQISDFLAGRDTVQLASAVFSQLSTGDLDAANFSASLSGDASDSNDYVLYDTDSGELFYDADGNGAAAKVLIAVIGNHAALTAAAIDVI